MGIFKHDYALKKLGIFKPDNTQKQKKKLGSFKPDYTQKTVGKFETRLYTKVEKSWEVLNLIIHKSRKKKVGNF